MPNCVDRELGVDRAVASLSGGQDDNIPQIFLHFYVASLNFPQFSDFLPHFDLIGC